MQNPFQNAMSQLDKVTAIKKFDEAFMLKMRQPNRDVRIAIPVLMDNGTTRIFEGYRVQYNNALGPYKGGIRYHQDTEINEVKALAFWMALKCAVIGIPMGGGKGGITVDPKDLSKAELERLSRGWVRGLADILGPKKDVPAPDVNTTPEIMSWMANEFEKVTGDTTKATFTGKPIENGGSEGRGVATGLGGFYTFEAVREAIGLPEKCTIVIQGFGNVGGNAAKIFAEHGHTVMAVSDAHGGVYNANGLDITALELYRKEKGVITDFPGGKAITNAELLTLPCDLLIPAALENQITEQNAADIKAHSILELANGPTTPEADEILFKKNIAIVPDILANAGGVTVSCFEWEQNLKGEHWTEAQVFEKLRPLMDEAAREILARAKAANTDLRRGAFILALERIQEKM